MFDPLLSISPLDGRYKYKIQDLSDYFSEFALYKYRVKVEIEWLIYLCNEIKLEDSREISEEEVTFLREIIDYFDISSAQNVKHIELETKHDVKAIEYYLKDALSNSSLSDISELIHFGCTSEDINSTAYALMLKASRDKVATLHLSKVINRLRELAEIHHDKPMLALTHGQAASPTTVGKEIVNYLARLENFYNKIQAHEFQSKFNGATGNYNAHHIASPDTNWIEHTEGFLKSLGLNANLLSTQVEPQDNICEYLLLFSQVNVILKDLNQDFWLYISRGIFKQKSKKGEIGSSTMPHKINPINFENSEGNLGLANALIYELAQKLPISRMQRDLSNSTVLRNLGTIFAYSCLSYQNLLKGLSNLEVNLQKCADELNENPLVTTEAIQTFLRLEGHTNAYEKIKEATRGYDLNLSEIRELIKGLELNDMHKEILTKLEPRDYLGLASTLTTKYLKGNLNKQNTQE